MPEPSEQQFMNALMRIDFMSFLERAFKEIGGAGAFQANWHHDAINYQLERLQMGDNRRLIVTMPPRHLKSIMISTAWVAWMMGHKPALTFTCVSYGYDLAEKHARDCLTIMDSAWYRRAFPGVVLTKRSVLDFETSAGGGRMSTSVGGAITGRGADYIIVDDPMKGEDALSEAARATTMRWFSNTLKGRLNHQETGSIILVMQRLHEADPVGALLAQRGWFELRLPAIAITDERIETGAGKFHVRTEGEAMHPERLSLARLHEIRTDDPYVFAAQYQQTPVPEEGNYLKAAWLVHYDEPPPNGLIVQSWDTASKLAITNDFTVCITSRYYQGRHYILDVFRERIEIGDLRDKAIELARRFRAERILIEDAASGIGLLQMLKKDAPTGVVRPIACRPDGDKKSRFAAQASRIQAGEVVLPRTAPWVADFKAELIGFPNAKHDDQADALVQLLFHGCGIRRESLGGMPEIGRPFSEDGYDGSDDGVSYRYGDEEDDSIQW